MFSSQNVFAESICNYLNIELRIEALEIALYFRRYFTLNSSNANIFIWPLDIKS